MAPHPDWNIRAVVFDLDGLLIDTEPIFARMFEQFLAERDRPVDRAFLQQHIMGRPAKHSLPLLREHFQLAESIEEISRECARLFHAILGDRPAPLRPGVVTLLDRLADVAIPHAIATSSSRGFVNHVFGPHGLLDRFRCILTAEDVTQGKPNPEIYQKAAQRLEQEPADVLVLEDSVSGVRAGLAAGAKVIAIPHEFSPLDQLAIAHAILPRLDDPALMGLFST